MRIAIDAVKRLLAILAGDLAHEVGHRGHAGRALGHDGRGGGEAVQLVELALELGERGVVGRFAGQRDELGRAAVVRNGFQPQREVLTGLGAVGVRVPKARSRIEEPARLIVSDEGL